VTAVPTDDRTGTSIVDRDELVGSPHRTEAARPAGLPWWRPVARWKANGHRVLPGVSFPIAVFAVWRIVSVAAVLAVNARAVETSYNYDGEHYLRILHYGYWNPRPVMPSHAFFPGISWFATPIYWLTGSDAFAVNVTITLTGVAAFVCVWGATKVWTEEATARRAVLLLAIFPSSFFLWSFYSEGLFIALGAGAVWADRKGRHGIAAACLLAIGTTRSIGILVPAVIVLARVIRQRRIDRWVIVYGACGVTGLALVLLTMWHQVGDPFAWLHVQEDWGRGVSWPWNSVIQGFENLYPKPRTVMVPALVARNFDLWCVPIVLFAVAFVAFSRKPRFPMEAWMLGVAMIVMGFSSSVLASFNRFVLADWIIFPAYAALAGRMPRWMRWPAFIVVAVAGIWTGYLMIGRFSVNRFVG
jgi:hypothetical protein